MPKKILKITEVIIFFLSAVGILAAVFYFSPGNKKQVGVHEYVRKGQAYIMEKKYQKGIKLLYKAYGESPKNEGIKKNLMYGYMRFAASLNEKGQTQPSIDVLTAAYNIDSGNVDIIKNLAYMYCKKAVESQRTKNPEEAREYFRKGIDTAIKSKKARREVSISLFNMAVDAFNKSEYALALSCLKASHALESRFETLDFLGRLYYQKSDLEMAQFYWGKAGGINPDDKDIKGKMDMVHKDILAANKMKDIKFDHFNIKLYKQYELDVDKLDKILRTIYKDIGSDLKYYPHSDTPIVFYSERDFRIIFDKPQAVRAFYDGTIRIPITPGVGEYMFLAMMAHEYTHAVISILTDKQCPVWLNEGIAGFEQARYAPRSLESVKMFLNTGGTLSIKALQEAFTQPEHRIESANLNYESAYTAVSFIIDKWGWSGLGGLLKRIKGGRHYSNAIDEEFLVSVEMFEEMWNEYTVELVKNRQ